MLEAAYARIGAALATYPAEPITVVLYTREQFQDVTRLPTWAAGNYDGRIRVPVPDEHSTRDQFETCWDTSSRTRWSRRWAARRCLSG